MTHRLLIALALSAFLGCSASLTSPNKGDDTEPTQDTVADLVAPTDVATDGSKADDGGAVADVNEQDGAGGDVSQNDAAVADVPQADAAESDAMSTDLSVEDLRVEDASVSDTSPEDVAEAEISPVDSGPSDVGEADVPEDVAAVDVPAPDMMPADVSGDGAEGGAARFGMWTATCMSTSRRRSGSPSRVTPIPGSGGRWWSSPSGSSMAWETCTPPPSSSHCWSA